MRMVHGNFSFKNQPLSATVRDYICSFENRVTHGLSSSLISILFTLWLCNIAMENGPFIDGLPFLKMVDLSMAMLVITRWYNGKSDSKIDDLWWFGGSPILGNLYYNYVYQFNWYINSTINMVRNNTFKTTFPSNHLLLSMLYNIILEKRTLYI